MVKVFRFSLILSIFICFSGCAVTKGPLFQREALDKESSVIYFYRPAGFAGSGLSPLLHLNGEVVGPLYKGGYAVFKLPPGKHTFSATDNENDMAAWKDEEDINMELELKSGDEMYFKFDVLSWSVNPIIIPGMIIIAGGSRESAFIQTPTDAALQEISTIRKIVYQVN